MVEVPACWEPPTGSQYAAIKLNLRPRVDLPTPFGVHVEKTHLAAKRTTFLYLGVTHFTPLDHKIRDLEIVNMLLD